MLGLALPRRIPYQMEACASPSLPNKTGDTILKIHTGLHVQHACDDIPERKSDLWPYPSVPRSLTWASVAKPQLVIQITHCAGFAERCSHWPSSPSLQHTGAQKESVVRSAHSENTPDVSEGQDLNVATAVLEA